MKREFGIAVVALLLVLSSAGPGSVVGGAAAQSESSCRAVEQDIPIGRAVNAPASEADVNVTVQQVSATGIRFTYHDLDEEERGSGPFLPTWMYELGVRVESVNGFEVRRTAVSTDLLWDGSVDTPSVTFTASPEYNSGGFDRAGAAVQPGWAFLPIPDHGLATNVTMADGEAGVVGDQVLLVGEHETYRRSDGCHDIELYIPSALETAEPPEEIADSLVETARSLEVGHRYDTVRVFGVGSPVRTGGRAFTHEVWVHVNSSFKPKQPNGIRFPPRPVVANAWVHEYTHTRQRWVTNGSTAANASWLTEAFATYYMVEETERQGRMLAYNETNYWWQLNQTLYDRQGVRLTDRSTWVSSQTPYVQGAYVLATLDEKIRAETSGERSLEDVFQRLNGQERVTAASFSQAVIAVGGEEMRPWLNQYVAGGEIPDAPPVPAEAHFERLWWDSDYQLAALSIGVLGLGLVVAGVQRYRKWRGDS